MSVFDVAQFFVSHSASGSLSAPKLQKLCFYAFGWYGYQTGEALFDDAFYAMENGPVVGDLLTASACSATVDQKLLEEVHAAWEEEPKEFDLYTSDILKAVWDRYGDMPSEELTRATQQEEPWIERVSNGLCVRVKTT
ncbi:Panacea domain-containing protein [Actinotignum sp. GS-2025a]|uniref:Panacea domain-containing protein n=1 Tax=Actinotignum sp. GS-2025a TaxID=3427274 RepID=UPI003F476051